MPIHEHSVYIGRRYTAHFFTRDSDSVISNIRENIAAIMQATGLSKAAVMQEILEAGIQTLLNKHSLKTAKQVHWESENAKLLEVHIERERRRVLREIYLALPEDEFMEWAKSNGYSQETLDSLMQNITSKSKAQVWLKNLLSNGPMDTADIRRFATQDGIIVGEGDWANLRQVAHRLGYTGHAHGQWSL